jgi:hypothetical protein
VPYIRDELFFQILSSTTALISLLMSTMPHFVRSREEWVIWLLADEFNQNATLEMLSNRMGLVPAEVFNDVRMLKRRGAVTMSGSEHQIVMQSEIGLTAIGKSFYTKIKGRSHIKFDKLSDNF